MLLKCLNILKLQLIKVRLEQMELLDQEVKRNRKDLHLRLLANNIQWIQVQQSVF